MKNTITKTSVRVFVGTAVLGTAFVPTVKHHKVCPDIVISYLNGNRFYNPMTNSRDWRKSEARKNELLQNITNIRTQIRNLAEHQRINNPDPAGKLIETVASTMMSNTRAREYQLRTSRAAALRTLPKFINLPNLQKKLGIVEIEFA